MADKRNSDRAAAVHLMQHYMKAIGQRAGMPWDHDLDVELEAMVDHIIDAAIAERGNKRRLDAKGALLERLTGGAGVSSTIVIREDDFAFEVWIGLPDTNPVETSEGFCIGVGPTRELAVGNALADIRACLEKLEGPQLAAGVACPGRD